MLDVDHDYRSCLARSDFSDKWPLSTQIWTRCFAPGSDFGRGADSGGQGRDTRNRPRSRTRSGKNRTFVKSDATTLHCGWRVFLSGRPLHGVLHSAVCAGRPTLEACRTSSRGQRGLVALRLHDVVAVARVARL